MSEATERPEWAVVFEQVDDGEYGIERVLVVADGRAVRFGSIPNRLPIAGDWRAVKADWEAAKARAELVVRAVNTHEEAIGLLREMEATLTNVWSDGEPEFRAYYSEIPLVLEQARALLSRLDAGGTP